jgi:Peptidase family M28
MKTAMRNTNRITRIAALLLGGGLAITGAACSGGGAPSTPSPGSQATRPDEVYNLLSVLAADSMMGRMTGEPGALKAATVIAREMQRAGLEAAGDSGFFQRVPVAIISRTVSRNGQQQTIERIALLPDFDSLKTIPVERHRRAVNVVGVLRGRDPQLAGEYILIDAHYDHIGVRANPAGGDSIFNGADDDASGVVAVLEIAKAMARGPAPRRTLVFAATTGEEVGLLGTNWYIRHPAIPLDRMAANLEIEMIGRPDSLAGGPGRAWLTGYERSTMGDMLARNGIPIVPDARPDQRFFQRSDNIAYARMGIPAHTLSSFNLHTDYHRASDEVEKTDPQHMASVIDAAIRAVRLLADGPKPEWKPGGRPCRQGEDPERDNCS